MTTHQTHYGREEKHRAYLLSLTWSHWCPVERTLMGVGRGEPCNWCGQHEDEARRPQ